MDKKTLVVIGVLVLVFGGLIGVSVWQSHSGEKIDVDQTQIIEASSESGNYPEMVIGNPDAPVVLVEYGDYQCDACAPLNPYLNEIVEDYDGKVAIVFRTMIMSYHANGVAAASAALAAYNQGYWKEFKDLMYKNLDDWFYSSAEQRQPQFEEYFMQVSDGKGDLEKFREDMQSAEVTKKINFDRKLADEAGVEWTPYIMLNGEVISQKGITRDEFLKNVRAKIDAELESKGIK